MPARNTPRSLAALAALLVLIGVPLLPGARRADPDRLPESVRPTWTRHEPALEPTWPDQPRFTSDAAPKPVAAADLVLFTSSRHDCLTAADALTGETRWRFVADGPMRFAPDVWRDRAYVVSDDGKLYCLSLEDGTVVWSVRGGPTDQLVLGNERLVNLWPARGAAVVAEDGDEATVYFGAGIWPFMGIFLHAVDARTGEVRWTNSGDGSTYIKQPHNADAFAGVAPQGELVVVGDRLLVPGGRSVPACYDRHSGKRLHYRLAEGSKNGGGPDVLTAGPVYVNGGGAFALASGKPVGSIAEPVTADGNWLFSVQAGRCRAFVVPTVIVEEKEPKAEEKKAKGEEKKARPKRPPEAWLGAPAASLPVPSTLTLLAAGGRIYGAGEGRAYALEGMTEGKPRLVWQARFRGTPAHLAYRDGSLFVSTRDGRIHAFGPGPELGVLPLAVSPLQTTPEATARVAGLLKAANVRAGYAVVAGFELADLAALLKATELRLIVLEPDAEKRAALRDALREADLPGKRIAVLPHAANEVLLPPYLCSLLAVNGPGDARPLAVSPLRPYGGVLAVRSEDGWKVTRRDGPPPGAGNWTHQNVDAANTRVATDALVKAPLGVLWYGGPGNQDILPRHGHGPGPQVVDGRCIVEGMDQLRAIDIYTGRLLWTASLPGLGQLYDNTAHQAGANGIGSNYVSTPEGIFVALGRECLRLDPETGKVRQRYQLPPMAGEKLPAVWSFLNVVDGYVIGASSPTPKEKLKKGVFTGLESSRRVMVLERDSGRALWTVTAAHGFRHNGIVAGGGRVYLLDRKEIEVKKVSRDGKKPEVVGSVAAYDLKTGQRAWRTESGTFGTYLSYSAKRDVLLESGLMTRDTLKDESAGIRAFNAASGKVLWNKRDYLGPAMIHGDRVLKGGDKSGNSGTACDLMTGKEIEVPDPITRRPMLWRWQRNYGCNTPAASEHLMLFRSGAAGFYDLCGDGGTGNLGGFRSSCTLNLVPAGGVMVVPDYTRTCTCSYQNQTSLALIHWPDAELWTFTTARAVSGPVRRLGINLGAPGNRRGQDGTLWLEFPPAGGPSPKVTIQAKPPSPETFRLHAAEVNGPMPWVASSGVKGLQELRITVDTENRQKTYTVRLHFLEPERIGARREFDVLIQGQVAIEGLDVREEAGGAGKALVREFRGVRAGKELVIGFRGPAVCSGVEVVAEGW